MDLPTSSTTIRFMERLTHRAWPALETREHKGWLLGFSEGHTRRANSVWPFEHGEGDDLVEKLEFCENAYRSHNLPVIFKLTSASAPPGLDRLLEERGYARQAETSVMTRELEYLRLPPLRARPRLEDSPEDWLGIFLELNPEARARSHIIRAILSTITPLNCFMTLEQEGETVACGRAVVDGGFVGLYDLVVREKRRCRGLGTELALALMDWGKRNGATRAYLQVMTDNEPGLGLYRKLDFKERYRYWYRKK